VRLGSFGLLCDALGASKAADAALPALDKEVVERVFTRKERIDTGNDARFVSEPPAARAELLRKLCAALTTLADARGAELLERVADAWKDEPRLERDARAAAAALREK
jgi:hypothetical protein